MKEEKDILLEKIGKQSSFKVPEGYFERLTSEVMTALPEKGKTTSKEIESTLWTKVKPMVYMAAMFIGAALIIRVAVTMGTKSITDKATTTLSDTEAVSDQAIDAAVNGAMMDGYALYVYLNDASVE